MLSPGPARNRVAFPPAPVDSKLMAAGGGGGVKLKNFDETKKKQLKKTDKILIVFVCVGFLFTNLIYIYMYLRCKK